MKKTLFALAILCALLIGSAPARAQTEWPPTIFLFTSDLDTVTVAELESGDLQATLRWHVAHVGDGDRIVLDAYHGSAWQPLSDPAESLPAVGEQEIAVEHPRNFGPPTYRLTVIDAAGRAQDQRVLVIPFAPETADLVPRIFSFSALDPNVPAADLAAGTARVRVSWVVRDRAPLTHITFQQVIGDDTVNVELPRASLYIPSQGSGVVAPVAPPADSPESSMIRLRLVVVDVISAEVIEMKEVTVPVMGTAMPSEATPEPEPTTATPEPSFGALTVLADCKLFPPGVPERGWIDSPGIPSPNGRLMAYVTNAVGDARLVIANADGSDRITVIVPDSDDPLWTRPHWSPDSRRIVFNTIQISQPGGGTFYVVNADGTDLRELATYTGYYDDFAWSADGAQIFYTSGEAQTSGSDAGVVVYQVYAVSTDGLGTPQPVTQGCGVLE